MVVPLIAAAARVGAAAAARQGAKALVRRELSALETKAVQGAASQIVKSGFDLQGADRQGISTQGQNDAKNLLNTRFSSSTEAKKTSEGNIGGIRSFENSSPEDEAARKRSLEVDKIPSQKIDAATRLAQGNKISDLLESQATIKNRPNDNENVATQDQQNEVTDTKELTDQEDIEQENPQMNLPPDDTNDPYEVALANLESAGYNKFSRNDIEKLRKSKFKVRFPWASSIIAICNFLISIVLGLISVVFFVIGLGIDLAGISAALFTFGASIVAAGFISTTIKAIGLGIGIMTFFSNLLLSIGNIIAQIYYLRNASIVMRHSHIIKKYAKKLLVWRILTISTGWIPFVGLAVLLSSNGMLRKLANKETKKVQGIIEKAFKG